jgi:peptidylprolyl isomerase
MVSIGSDSFHFLVFELLCFSMSALQSEILRQGEGESVRIGQVAEVHYDGTLIDGTMFDSSRRRGQTFSFIVGQGQVIRGWDEGVLGMKIGEQRRLIIPAEMGYGPSGVPGVIPPNATLVFEVELIGIS